MIRRWEGARKDEEDSSKGYEHHSSTAAILPRTLIPWILILIILHSPHRYRLSSFPLVSSEDWGPLLPSFLFIILIFFFFFFSVFSFLFLFLILLVLVLISSCWYSYLSPGVWRWLLNENLHPKRWRVVLSSPQLQRVHPHKALSLKLFIILFYLHYFLFLSWALVAGTVLHTTHSHNSLVRYNNS